MSDKKDPRSMSAAIEAMTGDNIMIDSANIVASRISRKTLPTNHPVVSWLKNRLSHIETSITLSDAEKANAAKHIREALEILTDEN